MAVQRVERLLTKVTKALNAAQIPYAIVGGNAVAAWVATIDEGAVRATKDVDLLARREDLDRISDILVKRGLDRIDVLGVTMFVDRRKPSPKTGVHIVFARERVRAHYSHPAPDATESVRAKAGYFVVDLPALLSMKLQSNRRVDQVHVEDLLRIGLVTSAVARKLPADLRKRLSHIRDTMED